MSRSVSTGSGFEAEIGLACTPALLLTRCVLWGCHAALCLVGGVRMPAPTCDMGSGDHSCMGVRPN